eukprot:TRINITY_DN6152_c0_g1_i1.p1 TRINITY_DN6152_c0_g1~~TRINITY_DN6152_c0_g1_i1.p1  ORF type:complete len:162 (-),score=46.62 TRINITY_DN6152_c0_g1_i1:24-452(-)
MCIRDRIKKENGSLSKDILDFKSTKEQLKEITDKLPKIDIVIAGDVIFNPLQLEQFTNVLATLYDCMEEKHNATPKTYLCYKSRHEEIDSQIVDAFENLGFLGSQVDEKDMDEAFRTTRIDIFTLTRAVSYTHLTLPTIYSV